MRYNSARFDIEAWVKYTSEDDRIPEHKEVSSKWDNEMRCSHVTKSFLEIEPDKPFVICFTVHRPSRRKGDLFVQPTLTDNIDLTIDAACLKGDGTVEGTANYIEFGNVNVLDQAGGQCYAEMKFADPTTLQVAPSSSKVDVAKMEARRRIVLEVRVAGGNKKRSFAQNKKGDQCTLAWRRMRDDGVDKSGRSILAAGVKPWNDEDYSKEVPLPTDVASSPVCQLVWIQDPPVESPDSDTADFQYDRRAGLIRRGVIPRPASDPALPLTFPSAGDTTSTKTSPQQSKKRPRADSTEVEARERKRRAIEREAEESKEKIRMIDLVDSDEEIIVYDKPKPKLAVLDILGADSDEE